MVLDQVIFPLHLGSKDALRHLNDETARADLKEFPCYTYQAMITKYEQVYQTLMEHLVSAHYHQDQQQQQEVQHFQRWDGIMALIQDAIYHVLPTNYSDFIVNLEPPLLPSLVLVHLDLQPQNLLFSRRLDAEKIDSGSNHHNSRVSSVLDWEDAAIADPRFELLLLGRKVCATREQAEVVWKLYGDKMKVNLGPLKPWLQLETCHSILTLLLQSMNLLNGGRNPWETSKDLWGKLEREMARWKSLLAEEQEAFSSPCPKESCCHNIQERQETDEHEEYFATLGIHPEKCYRQAEGSL
jgi:hypothetical protein